MPTINLKPICPFDAYAAQKVTRCDVEFAGILVGAVRCLVANAAYKTVALDNDVDIVGDIQFNTSNKRTDIYLLVLTDDSLAQVQTYATEESIETGTVERFATISISIGTEARSATNAFALLANWNGTLEPL